jgi:hypothetical protein
MKFVTPNQFADTDAAARKLVEIFGRSGSLLKQNLRG